jgi:hypothetical protein
MNVEFCCDELLSAARFEMEEGESLQHAAAVFRAECGTGQEDGGAEEGEAWAGRLTKASTVLLCIGHDGWEISIHQRAEPFFHAADGLTHWRSRGILGPSQRD